MVLWQLVLNDALLTIKHRILSFEHQVTGNCLFGLVNSVTLELLIAVLLFMVEMNRVTSDHIGPSIPISRRIFYLHRRSFLMGSHLLAW